MCIRDSSNTKKVYFSHSIRRFSKLQFFYISQFMPSYDFSKIEVRARFTDKKKVANIDSFKLTLNAFTDENYKQIMNTKGCDKKVSKADKQVFLQVPSNGEMSETISFALTQQDPNNLKMYIFAVSDCESTISKHPGFAKNIEIELEFHRGNKNSSYHEKNLHIFYFVFFIVSLVLIFLMRRQLKQQIAERNEMNYLLLILTIITGIFAISILCKGINFYWIEYHDSQFFTFEVLGQLVNMLTQIGIETILILIAWGWTIKEMYYEDWDLYLLVTIFLGVIEIMVTFIEKMVFQSQEFMFHEYDAFSCYVIMGYRLVLFLYFMFYVFEEFTTASQKLQLRIFGLRLQLLGAFCFLLLPSIFLFAYSRPYYQRYKLVAYSETIEQIGGIIGLFIMITSKTGMFQKISMQEALSLPDYKQ
eukprot:TRINITY_DN5707_c0_g2_i2.p1 TRINITY_DN5707_c0_g2~~TRINITY_DN5707_c0_g2_i2.p1  ORF type:complete len:418 (+),score=37.29 TRINITY_DN5707_c0_g2_i2:100-1353(+)